MAKQWLSYAVLLALGGCAVAGPNDVLYQGKWYRDASVAGFEGELVRIHSLKDGQGKVPWDSLPAELKAKNAEKRAAAQKASAFAAERAANPGLSLLRVRVDRVFPEGVVATPYRMHVVASSMARIGGGGGYAQTWELGDGLLFIAGFPNGVEGLDANVHATKAGTFQFMDGAGRSRTVAKWLFVSLEK